MGVFFVFLFFCPLFSDLYALGRCNSATCTEPTFFFFSFCVNTFQQYKCANNPVKQVILNGLWKDIAISRQMNYKEECKLFLQVVHMTGSACALDSYSLLAKKMKTRFRHWHFGDKCFGSPCLSFWPGSIGFWEVSLFYFHIPGCLCVSLWRYGALSSDLLVFFFPYKLIGTESCNSIAHKRRCIWI